MYVFQTIWTWLKVIGSTLLHGRLLHEKGFSWALHTVYTLHSFGFCTLHITLSSLLAAVFSMCSLRRSLRKSTMHFAITLATASTPKKLECKNKPIRMAGLKLCSSEFTLTHVWFLHFGEKAETPKPITVDSANLWRIPRTCSFAHSSFYWNR